MGIVARTSVGVNNIGSPLLGGRVEETRGVNFGPDGALSVERRRGAWGLFKSEICTLASSDQRQKACDNTCLGDVNLNGTLVTARDGVFSGTLGVLVPLESDLLGASVNRDVERHIRLKHYLRACSNGAGL